MVSEPPGWGRMWQCFGSTGPAMAICPVATVLPARLTSLPCAVKQRFMRVTGAALHGGGHGHGALLEEGVLVDGAPTGPLKGLSFVAKDLFQVAGHKTYNGNPTWRATHDIASVTASAVQLLLAAGATLIGKAHQDEMAYSLTGENFHYGTPTNVACPDRVPGGSSSGPAVAVAAGLADIGLGTDTAGSVRVPASYCGVLGFRPTHGRVSLGEAIPLAPSFDTGGWFTRTPDVMRLVGSVLLASGCPGQHVQLSRWLVGKDAFDAADDLTTKALFKVVQHNLDGVKSVLGNPKEINITGELGSLADWQDVFRVVQAAEVWGCHGEWVRRHKPEFGPGVNERFAMAASITQEEAARARAARVKIAAHMVTLLGNDGVLMIPTAPGPAPLKGVRGPKADEFRQRVLRLSCIAGLAGLPQVTLPIATEEGCPIGLSCVGPPYSDEALLELAEKLMAILD